MKQPFTLDLLRLEESATVWKIRPDSPLRQRLLELGFTAGTPVKCIGQSPFKDPRAYLIRGNVLALRKRDSRDIVLCTADRGDATWD